MMKSKKSQVAMEFLMTYGWAILVAIIAIGVLAYFGVFSPSTYEEFEIYEEGNCKNGLLYGCYQGCWFGLVEDYNYLNETQINTVNPCEEKCDSVYADKETCEQIEVDELELFNEERGIAKIRSKHRNSIYVQLTTEWLDKNCECDNHDWKGKSCPKGYEPYENQQGMIFCNAPYKDSACQKYKCGDYIVEIK